MLAMEGELATLPTDDTKAILTYQFALSIAVVRHLQRDPLLPAAFLPDDWPALRLRSTYRRFDAAFKRRMQHALRQASAR
jgi:phenylacetic acid degradation operon negative regulatory protein